jgi:hypothetical protein
MSKYDFLQELTASGLLVVSKNALLDLVIDANIATKEDARIKYLTAKQVVKEFGVTKYWLEMTTSKKSKIKVIPGKAKNSANRYQKQSVIDELKSQEL